jgi:hypothetical protein
MEQSDVGDQFTFLYGLITDRGGPVGIAPAFVMDVPIAQVAPPVLLRLLRLIGTIVPSLLRQPELYRERCTVVQQRPQSEIVRRSGSRNCPSPGQVVSGETSVLNPSRLRFN